MNIRYEMQHFITLQIIVYKSFKTLHVQSRVDSVTGGGGGVDVFHEDRRRLRVIAKK